MLILGRKLGQKIIIGGEIEIMVLEVRCDYVRLGITAPRTVSVHRQEALEQVISENSNAAGGAWEAASNSGTRIVQSLQSLKPAAAGKNVGVSAS
jgi:carbon storage regulator